MLYSTIQYVHLKLRVRRNARKTTAFAEKGEGDKLVLRGAFEDLLR
jgi:hypothetical protein